MWFKVFIFQIFYDACLFAKSVPHVPRCPQYKLEYKAIQQKDVRFDIFIILYLLYNWNPIRGPPGTQNMSTVDLAVVMPHSFFQEKEYQKKMYKASNSFARMDFQVDFFS